MQTFENADPQEIAKFNALAAEWWEPEGKCKPLHAINPLRFQFIQENCQLKGAQVLDIGCGGGILSESLAKAGAYVTGIDKSEAAIHIANRHCIKERLASHIIYQINTAEKLATERPAAFDIITCMELLEHVPDPTLLINACAKLIKPHGKIFFSTINRTPKSYLFAIIGAEYVLNLLPKGTHDYAKFIRPSELATWARANFLEIQMFKGLQYNLLMKNYKLSDDVGVNYLVCCTSKI